MTGDNRVVTRTSSHRLPVMGLYAARSSETEFPPASPAANSKATVKTTQHIPISQQALYVSTFIIRGNNSQVTRKMHRLNTTPLTGNAHFSPMAPANTYSRSPPLRIATGIKQIQTMRDFKQFLSICIILYFVIKQTGTSDSYRGKNNESGLDNRHCAERRSGNGCSFGRLDTFCSKNTGITFGPEQGNIRLSEASSLFYNQFRVYVIYGDSAETLQYALPEKKRGMLSVGY